MALAGGNFVMGSGDEKPAHAVAVRHFQMAKTLVTNGQYEACVAAGACTPAHVSDGTCYVYNGTYWNQGELLDSFRGKNQPAVCVDWDQAKAFAAWAGGRLPSEAEWEYAARSGGKEQKYPWGDEDATCDKAMIKGCGGATAPVCSRPAGNTAQGLCDMSGNAWEWTSGSAGESPAVTERILRGGAWYNDSMHATSAIRILYAPSSRGGELGFRVAR